MSERKEFLVTLTFDADTDVDAVIKSVNFQADGSLGDPVIERTDFGSLDPNAKPDDKDMVAAVELHEEAKAKASGKDPLAVALVLLGAMIGEARRLNCEVEDRCTAMEAELAEALGLDYTDVTVGWDTMIEQATSNASACRMLR